MNMRSETARIILILVTLCLPLQALASTLLPCLHDNDDVAAQAATSPCHSSSAEELPQQPLPGECDKCQFCQMLSATALLPLQEMTILSGRSVYAAHPVDHFYSFRPGELQRPPSRLTPA
jgi:hypothetical protein